jgi:acyl-coenzyme A synthetase/AMP-(fatty) acid ligase
MGLPKWRAESWDSIFSHLLFLHIYNLIWQTESGEAAIFSRLFHSNTRNSNAN